MRKIGINVLSTVSQKESILFEKYIYRQAKKFDDKVRKEMYLWFIYQTVGLLLMNVKKPLKQIKKGKVGWKSVTYEKIIATLQEHDDYIVMPFEVVEGVVECPKCEGSKTWSVQKQTRGGDEIMTTFSRCVNCGHDWRYSG